MNMKKEMKELFLELEKDYQDELDINKAALFGTIICNSDDLATSIILENIKEDAWSKLECLHNNQDGLELADESQLISTTFFILCGEDDKIAEELHNFMMNYDYQKN